MSRLDWLCVCISLSLAYSLCGADLIDKDGRLYRNYRIKEVRNGKVEILHTLTDGSPESSWVRLERLPDVLQRRYQIKYKDWQTGKTLREKLVLAGRQLERDLSRFSSDDHNNRYALAGKLAGQLESVLAAYGETADFSLVAAERNGSLLRVVGTGVNSQLRSGQYIYMYKGKPELRAFRMKLYPTGDVMNHARYGKIAVYAENTQKAVESATDFIGRNIGMPSVFLPPAQTYSREGDAGTGVVSNIYYVKDDKRYRQPVPPPERPGQKPCTPSVRPEQKPARPGQKPCTPAVRPEQKPDHSGQKPAAPSVRPEQKPVAPGSTKPGSNNNKKDQKSGGWSWLPEWGTPGSGINDKRR